MRPKKVLHPTDYSERSRPALMEAAELAATHGADLILLHVVETLGPEALTFGEIYSGRQPEAYRQRLFGQLRQARPEQAGLHVVYVLSEEDVVTAILRTANDLACDLIVLGTHGEGGWARWLTGSITEQVVRRAPCPVLVVKARKPPEELPPLSGAFIHPGRLIEEEQCSARLPQQAIRAVPPDGLAEGPPWADGSQPT
jgi:nucleotide-binding universal stress UspA family protein